MAHTIPRFIHHPHSPLSVLLPPPTTTPSLFSNHHHTPQGHCAHPLPTLLPHTHTHGVDGMCLCGCSHVLCVVCVDGMHIPSHRPHTHSHNHCGFAHRHTTTLWCVCVHGNTCHMAMPNHQPLTCMAWSSRFLHKCVQSSPLPSTLCVCGGLVVGLCWCGHLCECLCVGWLCCFPPHCVSCVPPCPHPSVSPHSLALVLLLVMVVIDGG